MDWLRGAIALGVVLAGGSVAYHQLVYIPERDREARLDAAQQKAADLIEATERRAQEEAAREAGRLQYRSCTAEADRAHSANWANECRQRNLGTNCALPGSVADAFERIRDAAKERCLAEARSDL